MGKKPEKYIDELKSVRGDPNIRIPYDATISGSVSGSFDCLCDGSRSFSMS